jgi:hypothetical protein
MSDESSNSSVLVARNANADTAASDMSHRRGTGRRVKVFAASVVAVSLLTGCSPGKGPNAGNSPSATTGRSSTALPSPTDTAVISSVPSVVPFVDAALKKQGIDLPLESNKDECHPGEPSHAGTSGNTGQTCRWHPDDAGPTGYRILSVDLGLESDPQSARDNMSFLTRGTAPRAERLGDQAMSQGVQFTETAITVRGRDQSIASSGVELAVRVHNVNIDITWAGADYRIGAGQTLTHVTGLTREAATPQATAIATAIIAHLR